MATVLVVGSTGHIGIAAIIGALRSGHNVLAVVRNQESAKKLKKHVPEGHERITTVEADVVSDKGVESVVEKVRAGALPAFQHVFSSGKMFQCAREIP
jgi:NAD(P)-dependent dehydrogenase (short-subunit alcohol dehydrogenase family)